MPNVKLLRLFRTLVYLGKLSEGSSENLLETIEKDVLSETELHIAPVFFSSLPSRIDDLAGVNIQLRRESARNEMNRFRYDVVIYKTSIPKPAVGVKTDNFWDGNTDSLETLAERIGGNASLQIRLSQIPNARLTAGAHALERFEDGCNPNEVLRQLATQESQASGIEPEDFHRWGEKHDLCVAVTGNADNPYTFDVVIDAPSTSPEALTDLYRSTAPITADHPVAQLTNVPYHVSADDLFSSQCRVFSLRTFLSRITPTH